ncbi:UDP-4-amino-4,6-dideoxy-N-acetyl-beta-L-altrosamine transaminase [Desulfurispira natronophila]|uniref:UDP-4-amino-4, 6-dideoxy-N-acetyl-beta-L-altrosamine transaminase n=1 Tax=Desulfurispira natronophila TaxID=682562 RepID=A0A7W7Y2M6_9BACT|nr:UDP-4-amino-4,6-dideoxy-N-acetyl-beta-L-altrosamine transaminase [Desulfurispira natronophila]MBB5020932.1 UDP-4-amino-4,6-dideoxy-N-acetyl-beta-L-altrosamine transaminase [Desulfurispira natronophila]
MIPYGRQNVINEDIDAVLTVLQSDLITQGPAVEYFESMLSVTTGASYSLVTNSATSALHLACQALGLKDGDWLWTVPNTFVASANCARYCSAEVDFVDINPQTANMCPAALQVKLQEAQRTNKLPRIIVPVHFAGFSCDMESISRVAEYYGVKVIEDASHAIGAHYKGSPVGSCCYSDVTVFSFHPVKIITTGEGGALLTQSSELYRKMKKLRSHGVTRDPAELVSQSHGPWYYEQHDLGYNYRMTDIQAALGASQLHRLKKNLEHRREIAAIYHSELSDLPLELPGHKTEDRGSWHLYVAKVQPHKQHIRRKIFEYLRSCAIGVNVHYIPVHTQPYYVKRYGYKPGDFPGAMDHYNRSLSLPIFPTLSLEDQKYVTNCLRTYFNEIMD